MLIIAEQWHGSDRGRQRQGNEDNFFVRSPLFVVADGMGGAQAGEVASQMAVDSFDQGLPDGPPAEGLTQVVEAANRRIHERSQTEAQRAGMGTTVTAAYVGEGEVTIAHVGDSRAYLLRDRDLIRLTRDHSLVGELVARGKLTEEQAESHPQRSVITRALGPEPDVQVDVQAYQARRGDRFLLCSDGLTSMIPEARVKQILEGTEALDEAGRELIAAANEAGGRDNITVLLFRLEDVATGPATEPGVTSEHETGAEHQAAATITLPAVSEPEAPPKGPAEPIAEEPPPPRAPRKRRRRRVPGALIALVIAVAIVGAALWTASRAVYFVGVDDESQVVTIYRGLPYELPFGSELYGTYYPSGVSLAQVPAARRGTFTDHQLRSKDDAEDLVRQLERGDLE
ncbi:MAG: Stp1/IreP family PP2C-type Ser/Thr phosphatase [Solirubrobacteraceae bacterium]